MMKYLLAGLAAWSAAVPAVALECPLPHAIYGQAGNELVLRFWPLPPDAAANQILAFTLQLPGMDAPFDGAVHVPNGYGSAWGALSQDCADANDTDCRRWEGTVYATGAGGIAELPHETEQMAPAQILLPEFAQGLWYSGDREAAFGDGQLIDVFSLRACAK